MRVVTVTEAKNGLSALIDVVRTGETVLIVDRGRPVDRLRRPLLRPTSTPVGAWPGWSGQAWCEWRRSDRSHSIDSRTHLMDPASYKP